MKIAMGTARGLSSLHDEMSMIHGNLTSANVLLDDDGDAKIADFGLSRLMTTAANSNVIATAGALGYRAPELSKLKKASNKTDVYSLGVILLELLTGKSPGDAVNGVDLPQWVASIVEEEWTNEVFDLELMREAAAGAAGDELLNTLKLALHCVDPSPAARPEVREVLRQLEEIKPELAAASGGGGESGGVGPSKTSNVFINTTNIWQRRSSSVRASLLSTVGLGFGLISCSLLKAVVSQDSVWHNCQDVKILQRFALWSISNIPFNST